MSVLRVGVAYAIGALAMLIVSRLSGPAVAGTYYILAATGPAAFNVVAMGAAMPFAAHWGAKHERDVHGLGWAVLIGTAVLGFAVAAALAAAGVVSVVAAAALAIFLPLSTTKMPLAAKAYGTVQFGPLTAVEVAEAATFHGSVVAVAMLGGGTTALVLAMLGGGAAGSLVAALSYPLRAVRPNRRILAMWGPSMVAYMTAALANSARSVLPAPMLGLVTGGVAVGFFSWSYTIAVGPALFVTAASSVLFAGFARLRDDPAMIRNGLLMSTRIIASLGCGASAVAAVAVAATVGEVFSAQWMGARSSLLIMTLSGLVLLVCAAPVQAAVADGRVKVTSRAQAAFLLVMISAGLPAAAVWGSPGFCAAYVAATSALAALVLTSTVRRYEIPAREVAIAAWPLGCAVGALALGGWLVADGQPAVLTIAAAAATYGVLLAPMARRLRADAGVVVRLLGRR